MVLYISSRLIECHVLFTVVLSDYNPSTCIAIHLFFQAMDMRTQGAREITMVSFPVFGNCVSGLTESSGVAPSLAWLEKTPPVDPVPSGSKPAKAMHIPLKAE
jgi:hypothetical protein